MVRFLMVNAARGSANVFFSLDLDVIIQQLVIVKNRYIGAYTLIVGADWSILYNNNNKWFIIIDYGDFDAITIDKQNYGKAN